LVFVFLSLSIIWSSFFFKKKIHLQCFLMVFLHFKKIRSTHNKTQTIYLVQYTKKDQLFCSLFILSRNIMNREHV
jgi:hypothetical protein